MENKPKTTPARVENKHVKEKAELKRKQRRQAAIAASEKGKAPKGAPSTGQRLKASLQI
jgi:hypothetical protein